MAAGQPGNCAYDQTDETNNCLSTKSFTLAAKPLLTSNLLFLDGISRSGKKLACRMLTQFEGIEYFQYISMIEKICHLHVLRNLDGPTAAELLRLTVDEATYARMIGRNLNTRIDDETSIFRAPKIDAYLKRAAAKDGDEAIQAFNQTRKTMLYHTHSTLEALPLIFSAFHSAQFIHVTRNPIDIAEDWLRRGWGNRWGQDPRAFGLVVDINGKTVPWHAANWGSHYIKMTPSERCIQSVLDLQKREQLARDSLQDHQRCQFMQFSFENFLSDPEHIIERVSAFIKAPAGAFMAGFLASEHLPNHNNMQMRSHRFASLSSDASQDLRDELLAASESYDQRFNI